MNVGRLTKALRHAEGGAWASISVRGKRAKVVMRDGEVRSAVGIRELEGMLGVNALLSGSNKNGQ